MRKIIESPDSRFIKVRCPKCKKEQVIFGKAATKIKCNSCGNVLGQPSGGKTKVKSQILEVLE
jgi:small subunit ribosomal protein S27e